MSLRLTSTSMQIRFTLHNLHSDVFCIAGGGRGQSANSSIISDAHSSNSCVSKYFFYTIVSCSSRVREYTCMSLCNHIIHIYNSSSEVYGKIIDSALSIVVVAVWSLHLVWVSTGLPNTCITNDFTVQNILLSKTNAHLSL